MLFDQIDRNRRATIVLFIGFALLITGVIVALDLLVFAGELGWVSLVLSGVIVAVAVFIAWYKSDRIVLSALGTREPDMTDPREQQLPGMVATHALAAGMETPTVRMIDDPAPNAFAAGRNPERGVVVFTRGLIDRMSRHEVSAVAAHEVSHIANRDSMVGVMAAVLLGTLVILCRLGFRLLLFGGARGRGGGRGGHPALIIAGFALLVLAPLLGLLLRSAISRRRESLADANAVRLTRNPQAMISALEKLKGNPTPVDVGHGFASHLWLDEPHDTKDSWFDKALSTHPPIDERIQALRAISGDVNER